MTTKEIIKYPDSILRKKSEEIKEITLKIKELALAMLEIMIKEKGIGLAASQIGELKRIIVIQAERGPEVYINPKIIKKSKENKFSFFPFAKARESKETEIREEGCLSFPGLFLKVKRAKEVEVEFLNLRGEKNKIKAEGLPARVFQHEIDHLDGILFIDRISFFQKLWRLLKI